MYKQVELVLVVWFFCLQWSVAQTTGTISGVVRDATGGVVPAATITVSNVETGITRSLPTDAQGRYQARNLSVGQYEVEVSLSGFQTEVRRGIGLTVAQEAVVNFQLQVGQVAERVEVTGEAPVVEATNAAITGLVDQNTIRDLPLNGRRFSDLVGLQVGTVLARQNQGGDTRSGGVKFSISGAKPGGNAFLLDGTDVADSRSGVPGGASNSSLGVDTVREFRVLTNSYSAEYGRASGGVLTAVTKSGTNDLHGSVFEFLRNDKVDASRWETNARNRVIGVEPEKAPFRRNQFGFTVGGPIKKNRTFFFGGYEALRDRTSTNSSFPVPNARAKEGCMPEQGAPGAPVLCIGNTGFTELRPGAFAESKKWLDLYPLPNGEDLGNGTGRFSYVASQPTNHKQFVIRGDHQLSPSHSLFGRYTFDDSEKPSPSRPLPLPDRQVGTIRAHYVTVQYDTIVSPTTLNTARFGMNRSSALDTQRYVDSFNLRLVPDFPFDRGGEFDPGSDIAVIGDGNNPRGVFFRNFEGSDDLTLIRGSHAMKTGFIFKRVQDMQEAVQGDGGAITFGPLGLWDTLRGQTGDMEIGIRGHEQTRDWRQKLFGFYFQDDWKWKHNLTLNLGVREEFMTSPVESTGKCANVTDVFQPIPEVKCPFFKTFKNNWAPRVGFAWDTRSNSKLVVRGGFGIYHDQPFAVYWKSAGRSAPPLALAFVANQPPWPNPTAGLNLSGDVQPPSEVRGWKYTGTSYVMQYNFNLQSEIRPGTGVTLGYIGSQARKVSITQQMNIPDWRVLPNGALQAQFEPDPFSTTGGTRVKLLSPLWLSLLNADSSANSGHNSMIFSLDQRFRGGLRTQVSYAFSKTMSISDTISGTDFSSGDGNNGVMDGFNPERDRGPAGYSIRHNLVANYSYALPFRADGMAGKLIQGWQVSGIVSSQSGIPFTALTAFRPDAASGSSTRWGLLRPNLNAGFTNNPTEGTTAGCTIVARDSRNRNQDRTVAAGGQLGTPDLYFDPCAFNHDFNGDGVGSEGDRGFFGNLGRNSLVGPSLVNFDFSLQKNTLITERINLQFRAEFFNIANHPNFNAPDRGAGARVFDNQARLNSTASNPVGRINSTVTKPRQVQFGLKLTF